MKPINLTKEARLEIAKKFFDKLNNELENFAFNTTNTLTVKTDFNKEAKEKVTILFTQQAYLRMQALVDFFDTEVGWYGMVEQIDEKLYRVYDVKVCKQYVNGSKVDTEDEDTLEFFNSLTDDEADHMHFQAHSHVNMSTGASGVDLQNQADVIKNMGKTGFYIFQIWNKKNDISTYLYDLDNNVYYDSKDVYIEVEDDEGLLSDYITSIYDLVIEKKTYPYAQKTEDKGKKQDYYSERWGSFYGDW